MVKDETKAAEEFRKMINSLQWLMMLERSNNKNRDNLEDGWKQLSPKFIIFELYYHIGKLQSALVNDNNAKMEESIGDIGNYLGFFLHNKQLSEFKDGTISESPKKD